MNKKSKAAHVAKIESKYKDKSYTTYLLRRTYREGGKVKQQTLGNLTSLPEEVIFALRDMLRGEKYAPVEDAFEVQNTRLHGHIACIRAMFRKLGLHKMIDPEESRMRGLVEGMIVARVVEPQPKLSTRRWWQNTTLPEDLDIVDATEDDLYSAMDWLLPKQGKIEGALGKRHLGDGSMVLYDLSSSYVEGNHCPLAAYGHNRDGKSGKKQVNYGLLVDSVGRPLGVEVYPGNTADPMTVSSQIEKIRSRFGLDSVVLTGDRGMITAARIRELGELGWVEWLTALRNKELQTLAKQGLIQHSLFDETDLVEFTSPDYPGERFIACRNPVLAEERARKRDELLHATQISLEALQTRVENGRLRRMDKIAEALGRLKARSKMTKHFEYFVEEGQFTFKRKEGSILLESSLDGIYVIRTSVSQERLSAEEAVKGYKSLSRVERAFRTFESMDLKVRPIHHWTSDRVRAHIFICMLAYYVEWHLREAWREFLFDDEEPGSRATESPVGPAVRSPGALAKANRRHAQGEEPVHGWKTLLASLGTIGRHIVRIPAKPNTPSFQTVTAATPFQQTLCERVGCNLASGRRQKQSP